MQSFSFMWSDELGAAIKAANKEKYNMSLIGDDINAVYKAVNQGIDAYLEVCYSTDRGDQYMPTGRRLVCLVSSESLPVLVRRLMENYDDENAQYLASDICSTLDIELI